MLFIINLKLISRCAHVIRTIKEDCSSSSDADTSSLRVKMGVTIAVAAIAVTSLLALQFSEGEYY